MGSQRPRPRHLVEEPGRATSTGIDRKPRSRARARRNHHAWIRPGASHRLDDRGSGWGSDPKPRPRRPGTVPEKGDHMSMFGVDASEVTRNVQLLRRTELSTTETRESFARAAWSGIAEPGDAVAGARVRTLGASLALTVVVERWPVDRVLATLDERGAPMAEKDVTAALARWFPRLSSKSVVGALRQGVRLGARRPLP